MSDKNLVDAAADDMQSVMLCVVADNPVRSTNGVQRHWVPAHWEVKPNDISTLNGCDVNTCSPESNGHRSRSCLWWYS